MIVKDEDDYDGVFSLDSLFEPNERFNKLFYLGTSQKGTPVWALYDGLEL